MKKIVLLLLLCAPLVLPAQNSSLYVAAKSGLSMHDKPNISGTVIDKIPYGAKISVTLDYNDDQLPVSTEGMAGYWRKVTYNNKTGYIIDSYLLPMAPPKPAVKDLKSYIRQSFVPFGAKLVVKSGNMNNIDGDGWEMDKQLYKNGAEVHTYVADEYNSDTYILPGITIQQAFLLLRLIPEFSSVFSEKDPFPTDSKKMKHGENDYEIKLDKETGDTPIVKKIVIEFSEGASYEFELYELENQVVIFFGSGV